MTARIRAFFKRETVLCIAALCAAATMLLVPPDGAYPGYIDARVLCLLLCLMAVVAGFRSCGAFEALAAALLRRSGGGRMLGGMLVLLPFFILAYLGSRWPRICSRFTECFLIGNLFCEGLLLTLQVTEIWALPEMLPAVLVLLAGTLVYAAYLYIRAARSGQADRSGSIGGNCSHSL